MTKNTLNGPNITNGSFDETKTRFTQQIGTLCELNIRTNITILNRQYLRRNQYFTQTINEEKAKQNI